MARFSLIAFLFVTLGLLVNMPTPQAEEPPDLEKLIGIPIMAGLVEDLNERIIFDKSDGRIIHVQFGGSVSKYEIMDFYRETLFQLGWVLNNAARENSRADFIREDERLTITITRVEPLEVILELSPAGESP